METILLLITAVAAFFSALGAFEAARATKRAAELALLKSFLDEYKSEEMTRHIKTLREVSDWLKANINYGVTMKSFMDRPYSDAIELTRRRVKLHYFSIHDLYETKYLKKKIYLKAMKNAGLTLFFDVVEPLDYWNSKRTGLPFDEEKYHLIEKTTGYGMRDKVWYREEDSVTMEPSDRTTERLSEVQHPMINVSEKVRSSVWSVVSG